MDDKVLLKDLQKNDVFWFENERYFFDGLQSNDSARATHIESDQTEILSRHSAVTVVRSGT